MMRRENYKSDLRLVVTLTLGGTAIGVPDHDFGLRFFTDDPRASYVCYRKGDEWFNCKQEGDKVVCFLNHHRLGLGQLLCEFYDFAPDSDFADGNYLKVVPRALDIELIAGAGDDAEEIDASVAIDIEGALADVRLATNNANEAAQSANNAAVAANKAAENANSATSRADIAIDAMRATVTQAEAATGEAQAAANSANNAANNANTATTNANNASARANNAADNVVIKLSQADAAIAAANTATSNANAAASNANDAADRAEEYIGSIDIENYYTKGEINQKFADIISGKSWVVVAELPARGNSNYIYLVPNGSSGSNAYDEYVWLSFSNKYEKIGSTAVDLSNYYTKAETDTKLASKQNTLISGTNIKTINNLSLLGAGNISIQGGGDDSVLKVTLNTLNGRYSGSVTWDAMLNAYTSGKEVLLTYGDYTYRVYYAHYFGSSSPPYGVINASYVYGSSFYGVTLYKNVQGTVNVSSSTTSAVTSVKSINGTSMQGSGNITLPTIAEVAAKANTSDLATVATSGSYNDLADKPTIPAAQIQSDWSQSDNTKKDYIKNKPTIPAAQVNADWNAASGVAAILNKPAIPVVPTNVSAFTNDASYATTSEVATKADKRTYVDNSADASVELNVATYNDLGSLSAWKPVALPAAYNRGDEFVFRFECGDADLSPVLPSGVVMADNFDFSEMAVGVTYQVSIMDGVAAYLCITPNS